MSDDRDDAASAEATPPDEGTAERGRSGMVALLPSQRRASGPGTTDKGTTDKGTPDKGTTGPGTTEKGTATTGTTDDAGTKEDAGTTDGTSTTDGGDTAAPEVDDDTERDPAGLTRPPRPAEPEGPEGDRSNGHGGVATASDPPAGGSAPAGLDRGQVRRLAVIALVMVVLGAVAGFGASLLWPTEYAGRASVLFIISQEQPTGFLREDRNLTTQAMLAQSNAVLGPVAAQYGLSPADLGQKLTVTVPDGSELLNFETRDPSPDLAVRLADSVTKQYLQVSSSSQPSSDQMRYLQGQLTTSQNLMQQLRVDGSAPALAQLPAVADRAGSLSSQLDTLMLAQVSQPQAQIVVPAYAGGAVSPRPGFGAATGAVTGLLVGLVTVAVLAWRWQRRGQAS